MKKSFVNPNNEMQEIEIQEGKVVLYEMQLKGYSIHIRDTYYFKNGGVIEKCECSSGWARNTGEYGGGLDSCIDKWKKRLGWKNTLNSLYEAKDYKEALDIINNKIDCYNILGNCDEEAWEYI